MTSIIDNYFEYAESFHQIKTKLDGIQPLILRDYQKRFLRFLMQIEGPKRVIALKPRQAGFSTICASYFSWYFTTNKNCSGLLLADKKGRTQEVAGIYKMYLDHLPYKFKPMVSIDNSEKLWLNDPKGAVPGMNSGVVFETGQDPNAGRSASRLWGHLTEWAFVPYCKEIDEGVQNSIPLDPRTCIIKESTANGRAGVGKAFFDLWKAAERGDTIYKPFFVAWYEIDDYFMPLPRDFRLTAHEKEIMQEHKGVTKENLNWRRWKIAEYLDDSEETILTPEERFCQDFPLSPSQAFLATGAPVFDLQKIERAINGLTAHRPAQIQDRVKPKGAVVSDFLHNLVIYKPPREGQSYFIGADVAEGLEVGDASSACVLDQDGRQVAKWHGKIDPDMYGHLLIDLGNFYNKALLVVENNNMGATTITTIRNNNYPRQFMQMEEDKVEKKRVERYGWRTTSKSKIIALAAGITAVRDEINKILDVSLLVEMSNVSREPNGNVNLNGKDRIVAFCLARMGLRQYHIPKPDKKRRPRPITGTGAEIHEAWEQRRRARSKGDIFEN